MLKEIRTILHNKCKQYLNESGLTAYRGRKEKIYIGGVYFNTVYRLAKKEDYKVNNKTALLLLSFFGIEVDEEFYQENNIIKLSQKTEDDEI